jgi:hypothetical protein
MTRSLSLVLVATVACGTDDGLTKHNASPVAAITSHGDGDVVTTSAPIVLRGTASDPDGDALTAAWLAGEVVLCEASTPDADGTTSCTATLTADQTHITLEVRDIEDAAHADHVDLVVVAGNAPEIAITSPAEGGVLNEDQPVVLSATTTDADTDPADLIVTWSSDVDGQLADGAPDSTGVSTASATLGTGEHVITALVTDDDGLFAEAAVSIRINALPSAPELALAPDPAVTTDDLTVSITTASVDPEGETPTYSYEWFKGGVLSSESTSDVLPSSATSRGDEWSVIVTPADSWGSGPSTDIERTIGNSPPSAPVVIITPDDPIEQVDAFTCSVATESVDADGDGITYTVAWDLDGTAFSDATTTTETGDTVPAAETTGEDHWTCAVTPYDGTDSGPSGTIEVDVLGTPIDYAHIQYPCAGSIARTTGTLEVYAWIFHPGTTDDYGVGAGISAEVGVGDDGTDPATDSSWSWVAAAYNDDKPAYGDSSADPEPYSNDEYLGTITAPGATGSFDVAYRVSTDSGLSWVYVDLGGLTCGGDGTIDGYDASESLDLTVYP